MVVEGGILLRAYDIYHGSAKKIFYWAQEKATCIDNANGLYIIHLTLRGKNSVIQQIHYRNLCICAVDQFIYCILCYK